MVHKVPIRVLPPMLLLLGGAPMRVVPRAAGPDDPKRALVGAAHPHHMLSVNHSAGMMHVHTSLVQSGLQYAVSQPFSQSPSWVLFKLGTTATCTAPQMLCWSFAHIMVSNKPLSNAAQWGLFAAFHAITQLLTAWMYTAQMSTYTFYALPCVYCF